MLKSLLFLILVSIIAVGCATREQIQREQMVDNMSLQMAQNQKLAADVTVRIESMEEQIRTLKGQMEEKGYEDQKKQQDQIDELKEKITVLEKTNEATTKALEENTKIIAEQKAYLDKVLEGLKNINEAPKKKASDNKRTPYEQAMYDYRKGQYDKAQDQFLDLLKNKKIKGNSRARLLHNLGMISYMKKNNDKALVYFSKLFTDFPKAPYNPNGLLYLGKTFQRLKKTEEAKQTFNELISRYPKSKHAKTAQGILKKM